MRRVITRLIGRTQLVYAALAAVWLIVAGWQIVEHRQVKEAAQAALINRSQAITTSLGVVIRSQRRFGGIVSQDRLESALMELVKSGELNAVALLNVTGEVVASAGPPIDLETRELRRAGQRWDTRSVTLVNPVDLGVSVMDRGETNRPTIVMPRREPAPDGERGPRPDRFTNGPPGFLPPGAEFDSTNRPWPGPLAGSSGFGGPPPGSDPSPGPGPGPGRPRPGGRPFRMDEKEYRELVERRGLHGLVLVLSTETFREDCRKDVWLRVMTGCFATVSVVGLGLAWRNLNQSYELQLRLLRASEVNAHLKEMNLAAAGLAHETRNPLNIIRGLAQMISKQQDASVEVRRKTRDIIDETDRVTAQLNEFINYSRPREVRRTAVPLGPVVGEVARALTHDLEEGNIQLRVPEGLPVIEADERLLRQTVFNLLLNAVQAVGRDGAIEVSAGRDPAGDVVLEIRDNGPGVTPEQRREIFKPYFTTHQKGTGLGLAVVQQIVLAHGWEIECVGNEPRGALFRITHIKPVLKG